MKNTISKLALLIMVTQAQSLAQPCMNAQPIQNINIGAGEHTSIAATDSYLVLTSGTELIIYYKPNSDWVEQQRFDIPFIQNNVERLDIDNETIVLGNFQYRNSNNHANAGSVNIYQLINDIWVNTALLTASDGGPQDQFGFATAVSGDYAIFSSPGYDLANVSTGAIYIFKQVFPYVWTQQQILTPSIPHPPTQGSWDFGKEVDIDGSTAIVSCPDAQLANVPGQVIDGTVFSYKLINNLWQEQNYYNPPPPQNSSFMERFGFKISLSSENSFMGVPLSTVYMNPNFSTNHITSFDLSSTTPLTIPIFSTMGDDNMYAGVSSLESTNTHAAYTYRGVDPSKIVVMEMTSNEWRETFFIDSSVRNFAINSTFLFLPSNSGTSVGVFSLDNCYADLTGDGTVNFFDLSIFLNSFEKNDPIGDWNCDGDFNFFDVSDYLTTFNKGC